MNLLEDLKTPLAVLATVLIILAAFILYSQGKKSPLSTEGFRKVNVDVKGQRVYLTSGCEALSMVVSKSQAAAIQQGLTGRIERRPGTHDLLKDVLRGYDIQVLRVKIYALKDNVYYANLYLRKGEKILQLDSRPSDAIATALRMEAPIYVKEELLREHGRKIC